MQQGTTRGKNERHGEERHGGGTGCEGGYNGQDIVAEEDLSDQYQ